MSLENYLPEDFSPFLSGSLKDGISISGYQYRQTQGLRDLALIQQSESHWIEKHRLPDDLLLVDAQEIQVLALDQSGNAVGRCSSVRVPSDTDVYNVPDWKVFYESETERRIKMLEDGDLEKLTRHEGTGIIVDPLERGRVKNIGFHLMVFLVRAIAEKTIAGDPFESFTWSIHNPGYRAWLEKRGDSPQLHEEYIRLVVDGQLNDPVLTPYLKALNKIGPLEKPEGVVAQSTGGLVKILNCQGGCAGYEESCERGVRVDGTLIVRAFIEALQTQK